MVSSARVTAIVAHLPEQYFREGTDDGLTRNCFPHVAHAIVTLWSCERSAQVREQKRRRQFGASYGFSQYSQTFLTFVSFSCRANILMNVNNIGDRLPAYH